MKKFMFAAPLVLFAVVLYSQHNMSGMMSGDGRSGKMMMSMHRPMMAQASVTGVHPDISFLANMVPHHQGAVDSSQMMLKLSKDNEIKTIARNIIAAQKKEIAQFNKLIRQMKKENKSIEGVNVQRFDRDAKTHMDTMMTKMGSVSPSGNIDHDFLRAMIEHHAGAVAVSKQILQYTQDDRIKTIAQNIIADQEKEINYFNEILSR